MVGLLFKSHLLISMCMIVLEKLIFLLRLVCYYAFGVCLLSVLRVDMSLLLAMKRVYAKYWLLHFIYQ